MPSKNAAKIIPLLTTGAMLLFIAIAAGGCRPGTADYRSLRPAFVLQYPDNWHLQAEGHSAGQEIMLTPHAEPLETEPRIVIHLQRVDATIDLLPGQYKIDLDVEPQWQARRYIILRAPLTPVVEVCAPDDQFEKADQLAADLAIQLARQFPLDDNRPDDAPQSQRPPEPTPPND